MTADPPIGRKALFRSATASRADVLRAPTSAALGLLTYLLRLSRSGNRRAVIAWRFHTAYGDYGGTRFADLVEFGKWCRDVGRYRTMDCNPFCGRG